jgi:hypothetical protein
LDEEVDDDAVVVVVVAAVDVEGFGFFDDVDDEAFLSADDFC